MQIKVIRGKVFINGKAAKKKCTGSARKCFVHNGIIVKVSKDHDDFLQCNKELIVWREIERADRKYFQRPIAGKINNAGGWIAQRLIKFKRGRRPRATWAKVEQLARKYNTLNDCMCSVSGLWLKNNWGVRKNGTPVIYDWGF